MKNKDYVMICNICNKKEAKIFFEGIVDGKTLKIFICKECAKKKGVEFNMNKAYSFHIDFLTFMEDLQFSETKKVRTLICPNCRLTYSRFKETSRLGCPECYNVFSAQLATILRKIHGKIKHIGKNPEPHYFSPEKEIAKLRSQLETAVKRENYEKAAKIRDRIQELTNETKNIRSKTY